MDDARLDFGKISPLPTFIHIGPGRSGSSMLYEAFKAHPDICLAQNTRLTNYFNREFHRRDVEWYKSFFVSCTGAKAIGEVCSNYIYDPEVPKRMATVLPDIKLISVLRNPFDRVLSAFAYRQRAALIDPAMSLEEAAHKYPDLITDNYYGDQLKRYLDCFSKENLLIAFYDDLEQKPERFIRTIFTFIGVDDSFLPKVLYQRVNQASELRYKFLGSIMRVTIDALRRWQFYGFLEKTQRATILRSMLFKPRVQLTNQISKSESLTNTLREHFLPQIKEIELLTGRNLANWYSE